MPKLGVLVLRREGIGGLVNTWGVWAWRWSSEGVVGWYKKDVSATVTVPMDDGGGDCGLGNLVNGRFVWLVITL